MGTMVKKVSRLKLLCFIVVLFLVPNTAFAHNRRYVFTEEYRTIPQGGFELENWLKIKVPDGSTTNANTFQYQEELEYGITNHWTIAHYEQWQTTNRSGLDHDGLPAKNSTKYDAFKFETKYRIGEKGKYWLDPLIYLEWEREASGRNPNTIEGKMILSKDIGKWNFVYNQILESKLGNGGRTKHNFSFGANYELPFDLYAGVEFKGNWWHPSDHKNELALGPTLAWEGKYFWVATGAAWALNHHADDAEARLIVGIPIG